MLFGALGLTLALALDVFKTTTSYGSSIYFLSLTTFVFGMGRFLGISAMPFRTDASRAQRNDSDDGKSSTRNDSADASTNSARVQSSENLSSTLNEAVEASANNARIQTGNLDNEDAVRKAVSDAVNNDRLRQELLRIKMRPKAMKLGDECRQRLREEISSLSRRGVTNLIIGGTTTVVAAGLLVQAVLNSPLADPVQPHSWEAKPDWMGLLPSFVPRVSLAVFMEIFAFFFLRLYRTSLVEIKFFQNELTNIELKLIALEAGIARDDKALIETLAANLMATERNFVIKPGETTIDIEREKLGYKNIELLNESLVSLLKADRAPK